MPVHHESGAGVHYRPITRLSACTDVLVPQSVSPPAARAGHEERPPRRCDSRERAVCGNSQFFDRSLYQSRCHTDGMAINGVDVARQLVRRDFPQARAAWLGGSVALGIATTTSDLDITVLLAGSPAPYRASMRCGTWPVEMFVQTEASLEHFRAEEHAERCPSTLRLIGHSHVLLDADGSGARLQESYAKQLASGPDPLTDRELRSARYRLTDLLDDLIGSEDPAERLMIATTVWHAAADLLLTGNRRWTGSGKWLHRELGAFDRAAGATYANTLANAVGSVASGEIEPTVNAGTEVLDLFGGRLFEGYRVVGPTTL